MLGMLYGTTTSTCGSDATEPVVLIEVMLLMEHMASCVSMHWKTTLYGYALLFMVFDTLAIDQTLAYKIYFDGI